MIMWAAALVLAQVQAQIQAGPLTIPAGTEVPLRTRAALSSRHAAKGDPVELEVTENIVRDGQILIPKGTLAVGEIARGVPKSAFGSAGKLEIRLLYLRMGDIIVRLRGGAADRGKTGTAATIGAVALGGALGFIVTGKSAVIPVGTAITGTVDRDVAFAPLDQNP